MAEPTDPRVAVYLDFDNIVMSWYDRVHGRQSYSRDRQKIAQDPTAPGIAEKLEAATVDVGALIDYAASFGSLMLTRAYADWSAPVNAEYRDQLVARAVDLVQLFPAAAYAKNGADIRLAVDAVEDMFRIKDLTHVVIVAGDSDYVPLAQRCKRLGCYVVGVGVAGSTAKSLAAACDEFTSYETLPGVELPQRAPKSAAKDSGRGDDTGQVKGRAPDAETEHQKGGGKKADADQAEDLDKEQVKAGATTSSKSSGRGGQRGRKGSAAADTDAPAAQAATAESAAEDETAKAGVSQGETAQGSGAKDGDDSGQSEQTKSGSTRRRRSSRKAGEESIRAQESTDTQGRAETRENADSLSNAATRESAEVQEHPETGSATGAKTSTDRTATSTDESSAPAPRRVTTVGRASLLSAEENDPDEAVTTARRLLRRALQLGEGDEWLHSSAVKTYMRRMDPSFSEKALGHKSFSAFLKAHADLVEMSEDGYERMVRAVEED